jgi:hypothetical protein
MNFQNATGSVSAFLHTEQTECRRARRPSLERFVIETNAIVLH